MHNLQSPESKPSAADVRTTRPGDDDGMSIYDEDPPEATAEPASQMHADAQDSYFETREPAELAFCIILAAAYAGLAKFCWEPLASSGQWMSFISVEGFFLTIALLTLVLGVRPYVSPSSLQISRHGLKYRGPYWPQRKTVNWNQVFRLYLSQELIVIFFRPPSNPKGVRLLFIQSSYLSDRQSIVASFAKYAVVQPVFLKNPDWYIKAVFLIGYMSIVCWILYMLQSGS